MLKDLNPSFKLPAFETGYFRVSLLECACILRMTELIYGAGGHGKVLFGIAQEVGINIDYFVDDEEAGQQIAGVPVLSPFEAGELKCFSFIIGIGSNPARWRVFHPLRRKGKPRTLQHPFTSISRKATIGAGVAVMAGTVVQSGAVVGDNVILNTSCSVDHDCVIHSHTHICPGVHLAGTVTVGAGTMIGTGVCVIPGITIGENCLIGAGSVVVKDIPSHSKVFGNPARVVGANEFFDFSTPAA